MASKYTAETIAKWLLSQEQMSPKKLQKMLYYCYVWTLTLSNEKEDGIRNTLFDEDFKAWVHGPVIPSIYHAYKDHGYSDIPKIDEQINIEDAEVLEILQQVFEEYGSFSGNELESISHQEDPWQITRGDRDTYEACNEVITDQLMFDYYIQRVE